MNPRYSTVAQRAGHRCEYCRAPEPIFNLPFEVEHIVPTSHGGADNESNWALSCRACNLHKGARIVAADPQTGAIVSLFNPREQRWEDHFRSDPDTAELVGVTRIGRATIACLQMNSSTPLEARRRWIQLRIFPTL